MKTFPASNIKYPFVELEGFEPSSKHWTNMPSTCIVCHWLSGNTREQTPKISP